MNLIIITRPDLFEGETELVNRLFEAGMQRLHLRKPKATRDELAGWIEQIEPQYRPQIVLHDQHQLAREYHLGGIHLNSRNRDLPDWAREGGYSVSRSCHSIEELLSYRAQCDYLFLSPIYDSISKEGYGAAFSRLEIADAHRQGIIDDKVYALGGVSAAHLPEVQSMGFGGAALLGDLWQSPDPLDKLKEILALRY